MRKYVTLSAAVFLFAGHAVAQSADDIINKNLTALGGKDKLSTFLSVYEENTMNAMGNDINSKVWVVNGKAMRAEVEVMGSTIITVMTQDTGWMINPMTGNTDPQPLPSDAVKQSAARMDLRGQFLNYQQNGYTATLLGTEKVDGKDNFKIKLSKTGQGDMVFFIDPVTYYVNKMSATAKVQGSDVTSDVVFADYKKTPEGFVVAYSTTITTPQGDIKNTLTKVVINQAVDPKLFQKP